jgi:hypothetical protein
MKKAMPELREQLLPVKRDRYFSAYIRELQKKMQAEGSIFINEGAMAQIANQVF